jgi:hypothetical protein
MADCKESCLHCAINDLVIERVKKCVDAGGRINLPDWAEDMAQSLADLILVAAPPEEHDRLLAHTVAHLSDIMAARKGTASKRN